MCGIAGILDAAKQNGDIETLLRQMTATIKHRGPDSDGFYTQSPVGLGMRRLSIIDLNTGDQPITNEDGTIWLIFNGEIYNYAELREELIRRGHVFKTQSDTEVIIHQYEEDGEHCAEKLRGMFAIAIWDTKRRQLILMRDRFGIKPLFVAEQNNKLAFASEMKAFFDLTWIDRSWNPLALRAYLSLGYVPNPLTVYRGIRKFTPGTVEVWNVDLSGNTKKVKTYCYWTPLAVERKPIPSFEEASEAVQELLIKCVQLHLRSDVPLGAFLSGGVDSSAVVALMRLCGAQNIKTFSIGFDDARYSELAYAEQVARYLETDHYSHVITGKEAQGLIALLENFDEPFADGSAIPTYFVSHLAREQVTVSLSGDGGDELFAGYSHYHRIELFRRVDWMPQPARQLVSKIGTQLIPERIPGHGFMARFGAPSDGRMLSFISKPVNGYLLDALSPAMNEFLADESFDECWQMKYWCENSVIGAQIVDQKTYLPDDILTKVDISSMQVSLEARVPLLDHVLADYVNSLPTAYKISNGKTKRLLKHIAAPHLPEGILDRPKSGFAIPLEPWLTGPLKKDVQEQLLDNPINLLNPAGVLRIMGATGNGSRPAISEQVWKLLSLSIWANRQFDNKPF
jgi:asparagine synthase (glutamine-hydrolysing)